MGGKRTDKERAWRSIEEFLRQHNLWDDRKENPLLFLTRADCNWEVTQNCIRLMGSGRLDSSQVWIVKNLIKTLVRAMECKDPLVLHNPGKDKALCVCGICGGGIFPGQDGRYALRDGLWVGECYACREDEED